MNTDKVYSCTHIWTCLFSSGFNASNIWPYMNSVLFVLVQYMTSITTIYKHEFLKCPKASTSSQHFLYILKMFSIQEGRMEPLILYLKGKTCSAEECFGIANYSSIPFSFALNIASQWFSSQWHCFLCDQCDCKVASEKELRPQKRMKHGHSWPTQTFLSQLFALNIAASDFPSRWIKLKVFN